MRIALTESGLELIEKLFPAFNRVESAVVGALEPDEADTLSRLLRRVIRKAE